MSGPSKFRFCHWLAYKGHTVVHLTRHCAMEMGKDILAIDPDGVPCAYQLKGVEGGGRITLAQWRNDLSKQMHPLVHRKIVHPSIPNQPHRSFIVINGDLMRKSLEKLTILTDPMQIPAFPIARWRSI